MAVRVVDEPEVHEVRCRSCGRKLQFIATDVDWSTDPDLHGADATITCPGCHKATHLKDFGKHGGRAAEVAAAARDRSRPARIRELVAECGAEQVLAGIVAFYREQQSGRTLAIAEACEAAHRVVASL